jgi:hypothetical protein
MMSARRDHTQSAVGSAQLETLAAELVELRDGQHELLRMYEELGDRYPKHCFCADMRDRVRAKALAVDPLAPEPNHEDYQPQ